MSTCQGATCRSLGHNHSSWHTQIPSLNAQYQLPIWKEYTAEFSHQSNPFRQRQPASSSAINFWVKSISDEYVSVCITKNRHRARVENCQSSIWTYQVFTLRTGNWTNSEQRKRLIVSHELSNWEQYYLIVLRSLPEFNLTLRELTKPMCVCVSNTLLYPRNRFTSDKREQHAVDNPHATKKCDPM